MSASLANGAWPSIANYTYARNLDDGSAWNTSVSANTPAFVSYPNNPALDWGPAATDLRHIAAINASYDLPFGRNHLFAADASPVVNSAVSGWTLDIATLESGFAQPWLATTHRLGRLYQSCAAECGLAFTGLRCTVGSTAQRVAQYFNPAAFSAPAYGTVGNASRDLQTGPATTTSTSHSPRSRRLEKPRACSSAPSSSTSSTTPTWARRRRRSSPPGRRRARRRTRPPRPH